MLLNDRFMYSLKILAIAAPLVLLPMGPVLASMEAGFTAFQEGNYQAALDAWLAEAEQGNATAQFNVGQLYRLGKGVAQDDQQAVLWYRRAAAQGYAPAQRNLQLMVSEGRLTSAEAQPPIAPAPQQVPMAESGSDSGLSAYQQGNFRQALDAWLPLAAQGDATAQFNLGQLHRLGKGVAQSDREAIRWYRRAALQGHPMALHNLRLMLREGRVPADERDALETIIAGLESGDEDTTASAAMAMAGSGGAADRVSVPTVNSPSRPMAAPEAPAVTGTGVPSVQMLSRPMIGDQATTPVQAPPAPAPTSTPAPAVTAPVPSSTPAPAAIAPAPTVALPEPPLPRPRPAQAVPPRVTTSVSTPPPAPVTTPSLADTDTPAPAPVTAPEPPPPVVRSTETMDSELAAAPETPPAPATDDSSTRRTRASSMMSPTASASGLVAVAEVLDMNSLVVKAEPVPVSTVATVPATEAAEERAPAPGATVAEPITVAVATSSATMPPAPADEVNATPERPAAPARPGASPRGRDWLASQDPETYVIQIMASNRRSHLERFLASLPALAEPVGLVTTTRRGGQPWYVLFLGPYPGFSEASAVLQELAASVKVNGPWIRQVGKIQSVMR